MGKTHSSEVWQNKEYEFSSLIHDKSDKVTFALCQKKNVIGHTAIVLLFDETPTFTLDFGTKTPRQIAKAGLTYKVPGNVEVNCFDSQKMVVRNRIATFELKSETQKSGIEMLCLTLINIDIGEYDVLENNCRDYVIAAYAIIIDFKLSIINNGRVNWQDVVFAAENNRALLEDSEEDECMSFIRQLKEEDKKKLKVASNTVSGVGGGLGGVAAAVGITGLALAGPTGGAGLIATATVLLVSGISVAGSGLRVGLPFQLKQNKNRPLKK